MSITKELENVFNDVFAEYRKGKEKAASTSEDFDKNNSRNDWIAYVNAYTGRASDKVFRNERDEYRANMVKAGGLIMAALEAHDLGYTP